MARSITDIYNSMVANATQQATDAGNAELLAMFANSSRVATWKILFYAVAFCIQMTDVLFDLLKVEIDADVALLKPASEAWYANIAKQFQYGYNLIPESDKYDNTGLTDDQVNASKIVAYAAVVEQERGIRIKVAKLIGNDLGPLADQELTAFDAYMERVKDAGIKLLITSGNPDDLKVALRVFYNPLVLSADGSRIDGASATPVQDALNNYLKNLPFNGLFVPMLAVDQLEAVDGVVIIKDDYWQARYGALDFAGIDVEYTPDAGYLRLVDGGLTISFTPHNVI